jgi:recombination protein RecT
MGNDLTVVQQVRQTLDKMRPELAAVLPSHLPVEAFVRLSQTALQVNPDLQQCTVKSVIAACTRCAEAGLQPDGEEAALVAYNVKVKRKGENGQVREDWEKQAKFMPMVRGIRNQVQRSGLVKDWKARIVYSQDVFKHVDGDVEQLVHEPAYHPDDRPILVYSIAYLANGEISRHVMRMEAVERIRRRSRSKDNGPWVSDTEEMVKKTCLKQHSKSLPKAKEDMTRQRIEATMRALDDAEGVVDVEHRPALDAPPLATHEAARRRLQEAVELSAFDEPEDAQFTTLPPADQAPAPETPKRTRAPRKSPAERLQEAEAGRQGNGRAAPDAAAQQTAAPSSSTPAPVGRSASPAAPAKSPSPEAAVDEGRDLAYEAETSARQVDDETFPGDMPSQLDPEERAGEDPEELAYRDGWNARFSGKTRNIPRGIYDQKGAQAWLTGYDTAQSTVSRGIAPKTEAESERMLDQYASKVFV